MTVYHCELCQFTTPLKGNYTAHVSSQKHIRSVQLRDIRQQLVLPEAPQIQPVEIPTPPAEKVSNLTCKHCDQKFAFKQSMYRHMKISCKKKGQELNQPVHLKITIEQLNHEIQKQNERLEAHQKQIDELLKMTFNTDHVNVGQLQKDILEQINRVFNR